MIIFSTALSHQVIFCYRAFSLRAQAAVSVFTEYDSSNHFPVRATFNVPDSVENTRVCQK